MENHGDQSQGEPSVKRRGPTILADIWNMSPDEKIVVKFNKEGQPYGIESTSLANFIGTIGRNTELAPQGYSDWRLVPNEYKVRCMNEIKRRSITNRNNQKNQIMPHCAGRQSFAQIRAEKTINGVEPSRATVFIATHKDRKTRDKKKIDEESAKAIELMKEKLEKLPDGIEHMNGKIAWKGDIFDQVIGKEERRGRVRGVGGGVCATKLWGESSQSIFSELENNDSYNEFAEKLLNDINAMQRKHEEDVKAMQHKHEEEMRVAQEKRDNEIQEVQETQNRLESHISKLVSLFAERATKDYSKNTRSDDIDSDDTSG